MKFFSSVEELNEVLDFDITDEDVIKTIFRRHTTRFKVMSRKLGLKEAWSISLRATLKHRSRQEQITKLFRYPMLIYGLGLALLAGLALIILPTFQQQLPQLTLPNLRPWILFYIGLHIGTHMASLIYFAAYFRPQAFALYLWVKARDPRHLWVIRQTEEIMSIVQECLRAGLGLGESLALLKESESGLSLSLVKSSLQKLKEGKGIVEAFVDFEEMLAKSVLVDAYLVEPQLKIGRYCDFCELRLQHGLQKLHVRFQTFAFVQMGIAIALVYQVFYYPLKLLEGMT